MSAEPFLKVMRNIKNIAKVFLGALHATTPTNRTIAVVTHRMAAHRRCFSN